MGECREQFDSVVAELERLSAHDDAESPAGPVYRGVLKKLFGKKGENAAGWRTVATPTPGDTTRSSAKRSTKQENVVKLLVLGAGESGKSTLMKQMKVLHKGGYSEEEKRDFVAVVHSNAILSAKTLLEGWDRIGCSMPDELATLQRNFDEDEAVRSEELTPQLAAIISRVWAHPATKKLWKRRAEFQLTDSAEYYFDNADRMAADGYLPTEHDVLRARVRTTGIVRSDFRLHGTDFAMYDMGGQRSERRKWIHTFEGVHAIIFVAALSDFDQMLFEDETKNRMVENIDLFGQIVNSKWFVDTAVILFLNKRDLFEQKLNAGIMVSDHFEEFGDRDNEFDDASTFFKMKFEDKVQKVQNKCKTIFTHFTVATDKNIVNKVFNNVVTVILEENLKHAGLM